MKKYIVAVLRNHFVFYELSSQKVVESYLPIEPLPCVPFYHYLFNMRAKKDVYYGELILEQIEGSKKPFILSTNRKFYFLAPDDATPIDKTILVEYFLMTMRGKCSTMEQYELMAQQYPSYIFISQTCRLFVFSYVNNRKREAVKCLPLHIKNEEAFQSIIKEFHNNGALKDTPVFVNRSEKNDIPFGIGEEVSLQRLLTYGENALSFKWNQ